MQNKKIIFLIPTLGPGGGERVVSELSLNLPDYIKVIIVLFKKEVVYPYRGKLVSLDLPLSNNFFSRIYYFFLGIYRFKKIIKKEKPDYVISIDTPANIINIILSCKKTIIRVDNFISLSPRAVYKFLAKFLYNKASRIICVSKLLAKDLSDNFGIKKEKITVIHNPSNIREIQRLMLEPIENKYKDIFQKPTVINIGRLMEQKGQSHLIRAFREVKNRVNDAQLVILGVGQLEQDLKQLTKDLKLENSVHFLGWQNNPFKFLIKSKVFVLSSLYEGFGNVLVEAMACGLPVVSVDCKAGPREILAPDTDINQEAKDIECYDFGILTPPFNGGKSESILAEAIVKILIDKELANKLSQKSKQRANDFDVGRIIKYWDFLGEML